MPAHSTQQEKARLRKVMRDRRRQMQPAEQRRAAQSLCDRLLPHSRLRRSRDIAFYFANDGELDPGPLLQRCQRAGKRTWLPCIHRDRSMSFRRFRPGDVLHRNHLGIPEPHPQAQTIEAMNLDLVLMPLVAFDLRGNRLGMGGGYYDRAFSHLRKRESRPFLMGIAHGFQRSETVPLEHWDVALGAIATESGVLEIKTVS